MSKVKLTVRHGEEGSRSLWIEREGTSEHRGQYELAENRDLADFDAWVERVRADYEANGVAVEFVDTTRP